MPEQNVIRPDTSGLHPILGASGETRNLELYTLSKRVSTFFKNINVRLSTRGSTKI